MSLVLLMVIFRHLLFFFMDEFNMPLQFSICAKFFFTLVTLILPNSFMNNLHMMSKVPFFTTPVVTVLTYNILDHFMDSLCVPPQMEP